MCGASCRVLSLTATAPQCHVSIQPCTEVHTTCTVIAGGTAHSNGLHGADVCEHDVLEIDFFKIDLKLSARPEEVPRALQDELVALDQELLLKLRTAGTFNSHLCHTYSLSPGRRPGLEGSDFVAMASGRVSVCWSLPGGWTLAGWMLP
jgi:hypothetical protein